MPLVFLLSVPRGSSEWGERGRITLLLVPSRRKEKMVVAYMAPCLFGESFRFLKKAKRFYPSVWKSMLKISIDFVIHKTQREFPDEWKFWKILIPPIDYLKLGSFKNFGGKKFIHLSTKSFVKFGRMRETAVVMASLIHLRQINCVDISWNGS